MTKRQLRQLELPFNALLRYDPEHDYDDAIIMTEYSDGDYVRWADVKALLERLDSQEDQH